MHHLLVTKLKLDKEYGWQIMAGKQDLGTFYMIYANFIEEKVCDGQYYYYFDFRLQNFAGAVTFGLFSENMIFDVLQPISTDKEWTTQIEIPVYPFLSNNDLKNIRIGPLSKKLDAKNNVLDIEIKLQNVPLSLFNPQSKETLRKSLYLDPTSIVRDGDGFDRVINEDIETKPKNKNDKKNDADYNEKMTSSFGRGRSTRCFPRRLNVTK